MENSKGYLVVEVAGFIDGSSIHHGLELFLVESVSLGSKDLSEVILGDGTLALGIEKLEGVDDGVLGVGTVELVSEHGEENGEVDGGWGLSHHLLELGVFDGHDTEGSVGSSEIVLVDESVSVGVDHAEGFLELLDLGLFELGEDVGGTGLLLSLLLWCHF